MTAEAVRPDDFTAAAPTAETPMRSLAKTVSWRAIASITTAIIAFGAMLFVSPNDVASGAKAAGLIGVLEVPSKLLLYYGHERLWSRLRFGRRS
jgi:sulfate adenylyltransferase subunit 1